MTLRIINLTAAGTKRMMILENFHTCFARHDYISICEREFNNTQFYQNYVDACNHWKFLKGYYGPYNIKNFNASDTVEVNRVKQLLRDILLEKQHRKSLLNFDQYPLKKTLARQIILAF